MAASKFTLDDARVVLEHLEEALTLLDIAGQQLIGVHVQMAIDLLRESADVEAPQNGPCQIDPC